jgi:hypothetical protein
MAMDRYAILVFSNPVEGREDEYNEWYDGTHLGDVVRVPGVVSAARYAFESTSYGEATAAPTAHRYVTIYELDRDPEEVLAEMGARAGTPEMPRSEAMDMDNSQTCVWRLRTAVSAQP